MTAAIHRRPLAREGQSAAAYLAGESLVSVSCPYIYIHINYVCRVVVHIQYTQGGRGYWAVYYTSPQSFIIIFFYSLA